MRGNCIGLGWQCRFPRRDIQDFAEICKLCNAACGYGCIVLMGVRGGAKVIIRLAGNLIGFGIYIPNPSDAHDIFDYARSEC